MASSEQIVEEIPTIEELSLIEAKFSSATEQIELLSYKLARIAKSGIKPAREMTAADAWEYTLYVRSLRIDANALTAYADRIERDVEYIMTEGQGDDAS